MVTALRIWLLGLTAASLILALAESMVTQSGIRRVLRLSGGVLMIVILLQPLTETDLGTAGVSFESYRRQVEELTADYTQRQESQLSESIAEQMATYIWDKARQLDLDCSIQVTMGAGEGGIPMPESVTVTGPYSEELSRYIASDLGIPKEKQNWQEAS